MIFLYTGTPGSGKSLHMAKDIIERLKKGSNVIGNFPIFDDIFYKKYFNFRKVNGSWFRKVKDETMGNYLYIPNEKINVMDLVKYAKKNHTHGREAQTLLCIDECQILFNCREYYNPSRMDWINFFIHHRKLGYNIILIAQHDKLIDKQIRVLVETEIVHRRVNNYKLGVFIRFPLFIAIEKWKVNNLKVQSEFFVYRKIYGAKFYDSYRIFEIPDELVAKT